MRSKRNSESKPAFQNSGIKKHLLNSNNAEDKDQRKYESHAKRAKSQSQSQININKSGVHSTKKTSDEEFNNIQTYMN